MKLQIIHCEIKESKSNCNPSYFCVPVTGSEEEKNDLKNAYLAGKGDMDYIVDQVQFARSEHEPRLRGILTVIIFNILF